MPARASRLAWTRQRRRPQGHRREEVGRHRLPSLDGALSRHRRGRAPENRSGCRQGNDARAPLHARERRLRLAGRHQLCLSEQALQGAAPRSLEASRRLELAEPLEELRHVRAHHPRLPRLARPRRDPPQADRQAPHRCAHAGPRRTRFSIAKITR